MGDEDDLDGAARPKGGLGVSDDAAVGDAFLRSPSSY